MISRTGPESRQRPNPALKEQYLSNDKEQIYILNDMATWAGVSYHQKPISHPANLSIINSSSKMVQTRRQAGARGAEPLMTAEQLPPTRAPVRHACQDRPPRPMIPGTTADGLPEIDRDPNPAPRRQCTIPPNAGVRYRMCAGWRLGYDAAQRPGHGPNFRVCKHCARRNWDRYTWSRSPVGVDLCRPCSRYMRLRGFAGDGRSECICHIRRPDRRVHLCTDCRKEQRQREYQRVARRIRQRTLLQHLHARTGDYCNRIDCTRLEHFIDANHLPRGESGCLCGRDDAEKLFTYEIDPDAPDLDLCGMVRVCLHCRREMFMILRPG